MTTIMDIRESRALWIECAYKVLHHARLGEVEEAEATIEHAVELDPLYGVDVPHTEVMESMELPQ